MTTTRGILGKAPHEAAGLRKEDLLAMYRFMYLSRALSQRMWVLQRAGKTAFAVTGEGQEAIQVASAYALDKATDIFVPYYRDLGVVLVAGMTAREAMLNALARAEDPASGGRQLPAHWYHPVLKIVSGSSPVGTQIVHAAGIALAAKLRKEPSVAICYFGEGATSTGDFHEGLNFAGIHKLPVVYVCENNGYAISVPQRKQAAVPDLAVRAAGYGFPGVTIDGNDVLAAYRATRQAVDRARSGEGPTFIEAKTYRLGPHTSNDDPLRYRSAAEVEDWRKRDPMDRFRRYLFEWDVLTNELDASIAKEIAEAVNDATHFAESRPVAAPETALDHVYAQVDRQ